ncbi:MAG: hypothetical protein RL685_1284 [Pseudomonadota bacterium]|jgi:tetratricopeptide (TPR) repeat protein
MNVRVPVTFGPFRLDAEGLTLSCAEREVSLQPKALQLLVHLAGHPNRTLTKSQLIDHLWPNTFVSENSLAVAINAIRTALGESAARPRYVQTLARRGYRFVLPDPPSPAVQCLVDPPSVVGRDQELAQLERWWSESSTSGQVAFVIGEVGSGKTTVVEQFAARLERSPASPAILSGRCLALQGAGAPFLPLLEALRGGLQGPERELLAASLKQYAPTWFQQFPTLAVEARPAQEARERLPTFDRAQLLGELIDALQAFGRNKPLLCIIEDLHWVDPSSVDWIAVLCARPGGSGFSLLGTFRAEGVPSNNVALSSLQLALRRSGRSRELVLGGLTIEHLELLLAVRFPNNDFAGGLAPLLHRRTEGHALFATRILDLLIERGDLCQQLGRWVLRRPLGAIELDAPRVVLDAIRERTDGLSQVERRTLRQASVLGDELESATLARLLDVDELVLEERLRRLETVHGVLVEMNESGGGLPHVGVRFRFSHVLFRESAYAELGLGERVALHLRLARLLTQGADPLDAARAVELALHFERGRDFEQAVVWLARAADGAGRVHSDVEALRHLERGLELISRVDRVYGLAWGAVLSCKLGWLHLRSRHGALGKLAFEAALDRARALRALERTPRGTAVFSTVLEFLEQPYADAFGLSAAAQVVPDARRLGPACLEVAALQGVWAVERWVSIEGVSVVSEQLMALAQAVDSAAVRAHALVACGQADVVAGRLGAARAHLDEALSLCRKERHDALLPLLLCTRADVSLITADFAAAEQDASVALCASFALNGVGRALASRGLARGKLGRVAEALADFHEVERIFEQSGRANPYTWRGAWLHRELGDGEGAVRRSMSSASTWREQFPAERWALAELRLGLDQAASGHSFEAQQSLQEAARAMHGFSGQPLLVELGRRELETAIAVSGGLDEPAALACAERWMQLADAHGAREDQVHARLEIARLLRATQPALALAAIEVALGHLEGHPMPFSAYKLLATRAQLADLLGQAGAKAARSRASALVEEIAGAIGDAALEDGFRRVARSWQEHPSSVQLARRCPELTRDDTTSRTQGN